MATNILGLFTSNVLNVSTLYLQGTDIRDLFVSLSAFNQSNSGSQLQLQNYVTNTALTTTLTGYQRTVSSTNKISYSFISNPPDLSIYATASVLSSYITNTSLQDTLNLYQTRLNDTTNRLPYTHISGTPNLATYTPVVNPTFRNNIIVTGNITSPASINIDAVGCNAIFPRTGGNTVTIWPGAGANASYFLDGGSFIGSNLIIQGALLITGKMLYSSISDPPSLSNFVTPAP